jgi:hypothetical protein
MEELLRVRRIWHEDMTDVALFAGRSVLLLSPKDDVTPVAFLRMLVRQDLNTERLETLMRYGLGFSNVVDGIKRGQGGYRAIYYQMHAPSNLWDLVTDTSWRGHK